MEISVLCNITAMPFSHHLKAKFTFLNVNNVTEEKDGGQGEL